MNRNMDIIKQLGSLALASRLKRLSDALMQGVEQLYREQEVTFHPRWFPVAYLLKQKSPMAVTEIAEALGMTHPAVNQTAAQMTRHGLLLSRKDKKDERRRLLSLSKKVCRRLKHCFRSGKLSRNVLTSC